MCVSLRLSSSLGDFSVTSIKVTLGETPVGGKCKPYDPVHMPGKRRVLAVSLKGVFSKVPTDAKPHHFIRHPSQPQFPAVSCDLPSCRVVAPCQSFHDVVGS